MKEIELQAQVADYLRLQYPDVLFHSDFGSGIKLSMSQAVRQKRLNGGRRSWPDMFIAKPKLGVDRDGQHFYQHGLFLELKKDGVRVFKRDGSLVADEHIREQYKMLQRLMRLGYRAEFAIGFDQAKRIIDRYLN